MIYSTPIKKWLKLLMLCALVGYQLNSNAQIISTFAGNYEKSSGYGGDGTVAADLHILPTGIITDPSGNMLFINGNAIRKLDANTYTVSTIAGSATAGFSGDGSDATLALFNAPAGLLLDAVGNTLYVSDQGNHVIRKIILSTNIVSTVAGNGFANYTGDGGLATSAGLNAPAGITMDGAKNIYIADRNNQRIRKIDAATNIVSTIAGNGTAGFSGDGGLATSASINNPAGISIDAAGNVYIADRSNHRIRKIGNDGKITTFAGNGSATYSGDGGNATSAGIRNPNNVLLDGSTALISEFNGRIRTVNLTTGIISTYAGNGIRGFNGDGGSPLNASISFSTTGGISNSICRNVSGDIYMADGSNHIRKINAASTIISTIAGSNSYGGDGQMAVLAQLKNPGGIAVADNGDVYIADYANHRIRVVNKTTGIITTFAGTGFAGYKDDTLASGATFRNPVALAFDGGGNLLIADQGNNAIRSIDPISKQVTTVAGSGVSGFAGDNGNAKLAKLFFPGAIAIDNDDNIYIADMANYRIRKVNNITGVITTVAGKGTNGYSGDNGTALNAQISSVTGIAIANGNLYLADQNNNVIRLIDGSNTIYTIAGDGNPGYSGDGGDATDAELAAPSGIATDADGNLYIADAENDVIRRLHTASGKITTIAGNNIAGYSGDGGLAVSATMRTPYAIAFANDKWMYITDKDNNVIRKLVSEVPFPVKLTSFTAVPETGGKVKLSWTAVEDKPGAAFMVQRSDNGKQFVTFETVYANAIAHTSGNYMVEDNTGNINVPRLYYRLIIVDENGNKSFSNVKVVIPYNQSSTIEVWPNPASGVLNISANNINAICIYNAQGILLEQYSYNPKTLSVSGKPNGLYYIVITTTVKQVETKKIVVQH